MCCSKKAWSMASDAQPSVTKLNGPSRVVIGPNGPELHTGDDEGKEAPSSQPEQGPAMLREANQPRQGVRWALQSTAGSEAVRPGTVDYTKFERFLLSEGSSSEFEQEVVGDNVGGSSKPEAPGTLVAGQRQPESSEERRLTRNGGKEEGHWWAQDRDEVTVHVKVPPMLRGPQVKVKAVARRLTAWVEAGASQEVLVDRELAGSVQESEDGYLDEWEITRTCGMSFLSIPLRKEHPMSGVHVWWPCAFKGDAQVDTTQFEDRTRAEQAKQAQQALEEAERTFRASLPEESCGGGRQVREWH